MHDVQESLPHRIVHSAAVIAAVCSKCHGALQICLVMLVVTTVGVSLRPGFVPRRQRQRCIVAAAGGNSFIPDPNSPKKLQFAKHEFTHHGLDQRPSGLDWLLQQWNALLRTPPPSAETKKENPLWATAAAPGCGKSHFVDELYEALQQENPNVLQGTGLSQVVCLRASFNSNWGFDREAEASWTPEQQLIARILCVACGYGKWRAFAHWFASTALAQITLRQLVTDILPSNSLVVLLLDETLLLRGKATDGTSVTDLYHLVSELSDKLFRAPDIQTRVLSLVTSLHSAYLQQMKTATRRPIQYVRLDRLNPRTVVAADRWRLFYETIGQPQEGCVDPVALLFDMCMGHPRSIASVNSYLGGDDDHPNHRPSAGAPLDTYITTVSGLISIRVVDVWDEYATLPFLCPVFLDLKVPGANKDHVPLGAQLVLEGFYVNDFEAANAKVFVPVTTAYQLYNFFRRYGEPQLGATHGLEASVTTIRKKMTERQPTMLDGFLPALFHLRLSAMQAAVTALPDPQLFGAAVNLQLYPFLFHDERTSYPGRVGLIEVHDAQTCSLELTDLELVHNRLRHGTCAGFPDANAENLLSFDKPSVTTFVAVKRETNPALDFAIRAWCRRVARTTVRARAVRATRRSVQRPQDDMLVGLTIFGQNKRGQRSYFGATRVRKWINKLQNVADEYLARRPDASDEEVVLLLVLLCTDAEDIDTAAVMAGSNMGQKFTYTEDGKERELPAVRYPVVILGRDDVFRLLGSSFADFFKGQLLASIQADASRPTIEQETRLQAESSATNPLQMRRKK